jgi:diguanylate cyclase (GGDEF)-like protein
MTSNLLLKLLASLLALVMLVSPVFVGAEEYRSNEDLVQLAQHYLVISPGKTGEVLDQLRAREFNLNKEQVERYYLFRASFLGYQGKHAERIKLIQTFLENNLTSNIRANFLYELSDAFIARGEHEQALIVMNQSILLLPELTGKAKAQVLHAAVTLLNSLHAFDDAKMYADRLVSTSQSEQYKIGTCMGMADLVDIQFLNGQPNVARRLVSEAIQICDAAGLKNIVLILKAFSVIDLIDSEKYVMGLEIGKPLLVEFKNNNQSSDNLFQLEDAIARAYLNVGDLSNAELHGLKAYHHAKSEGVVQLLEKSSETMAKIKRAQGNMASALDYYDINLALKKKVLDDQLHKNLAYQRVKFDTQDKANQLNLLEQKNKILSTEKQLEQKNNQNLLMLITLGAILMVVLLAWTLKIIRQKNLFRLSSQLDALTQLSNRGHFVACGMQQFEKTQGDISVILFDMDHFKNINDGFGHASGDWVLKAVSARVTALLPKAEMLGRLGGEEFAICLPKFDTHQALALAESCRAAIAAIDSLPSGFAFPITASFGVASRGMRELKEFEDTLAAADKALYFSKTEGRNRVSLYQ